MADTELSSKLYEKASAEQDKIQGMAGGPAARRYLEPRCPGMRCGRDILMEIGALELPDDQARGRWPPGRWRTSTRPSPRWSIPGIWMLVRGEHRRPGSHFKYGTGCAGGGCQMEMESQGKTGRRVPC